MKARWHIWCPWNRPFIDWYEVALLPQITFCWMAGFRGLRLAFGPFHWHLGWNYCDNLSHNDL